MAAPLPVDLTPETLEAVGGPIAAGLLPAWRVTWLALPQAELDAWGAEQDPPLPGPNLAIVQSMPTRRMATARVATPWPDGEDLGETLHHEIGHAWLSPMTQQLVDSPSTMMLEEQLVETLGVYLASLTGRARAAARRALSSVVDAYAPATLRARISAAAITRARSGGTMDPKMIMEALEALIGGDAEKCQEILKGLIASAAGGGALPPAGEPDGDEPMAEMEKPGASPPAGGSPMAPKLTAPVGAPAAAEAPRVAARLAELDTQVTRARQSLERTEANERASAGVVIRGRLRELRQDGVQLATAKEAELAKMTDVVRFEERVADMLEGRKMGAPGGARARGALTGVGGHAATPPPSDAGAPPLATAEQLRAEGADEGFVASYTQLAGIDANAAAGLLAGFRSPDAVAHRARLSSKGPTGRAHAGRAS